MYILENQCNAKVRKMKYENSVLDTVDKYKYLGTILNGHLNFTVTADVLAGVGERVLGSVVSKFSKFRI